MLYFEAARPSSVNDEHNIACSVGLVHTSGNATFAIPGLGFAACKILHVFEHAPDKPTTLTACELRHANDLSEGDRIHAVTLLPKPELHAYSQRSHLCFMRMPKDWRTSAWVNPKLVRIDDAKTTKPFFWGCKVDNAGCWRHEYRASQFSHGYVGYSNTLTQPRRDLLLPVLDVLPDTQALKDVYSLGEPYLLINDYSADADSVTLLTNENNKVEQLWRHNIRMGLSDATLSPDPHHHMSYLFLRQARTS
jgi:hypothetical protein